MRDGRGEVRDDRGAIAAIVTPFVTPFAAPFAAPAAPAASGFRREPGLTAAYGYAMLNG